MYFPVVCCVAVVYTDLCDGFCIQTPLTSGSRGSLVSMSTGKLYWGSKGEDLDRYSE